MERAHRDAERYHEDHYNPAFYVKERKRAVLLFLLFFFVKFTHYIPASGARPTQHHIYRQRHFCRAAGSLRLCRLPKGLA